MTTIHIQLDDATYRTLCAKAAAAGLTPEAYLARQAGDEAETPGASVVPATPASDQSIIGLFADEPELVDEVEANIMQWRRERNATRNYSASGNSLDSPDT